MADDRRRQAAAPEEGPDHPRLTLERGRRRRIVEEDDAQRARGNRGEALVEREHLGGRLGVDLAQERLAEVGQLRIGEPADEALGADDPDARSPDLPHRVAALQDLHPGLLEQRGHLPAAVGVPVVVPGTATTGVAIPRQMSARIAACSGSPYVVRSPASRMRSASRSASWKAAATASRFSSEQWMSPAAAMRMEAHPGGVPRGSRFANGDPGYPLSR